MPGRLPQGHSRGCGLGTRGSSSTPSHGSRRWGTGSWKQSLAKEIDPLESRPGGGIFWTGYQSYPGPNLLGMGERTQSPRGDSENAPSSRNAPSTRASISRHRYLWSVGLLAHVKLARCQSLDRGLYLRRRASFEPQDPRAHHRNGCQEQSYSLQDLPHATWIQSP